MKRLILFLLFLSCHFLLPQNRETLHHDKTLSPAAISFNPTSPSFSSSATSFTSRSPEEINYRKEFFKRRPVGLNDTHEQALVVYTFDTRLLFVYIHTRYRTYSKTLHNVAINLSDWRGPPSLYI